MLGTCFMTLLFASIVFVVYVPRTMVDPVSLSACVTLPFSGVEPRLSLLLTASESYKHDFLGFTNSFDVRQLYFERRQSHEWALLI